jgi:uncharacterized protein YjbI with pentapeptide repeats
MANQEHLDILKQGVEAWNQWREKHPHIQPDLYKANLSGADLRGANFREANLYRAHLERVQLTEANLRGAHLIKTHLRKAHLSRAYLSRAELYRADLSGAYLIEASLREAHLSGANLSGAHLSGADLSRATLVETNLANATLTNCLIYGIAAWNVELKGARQDNLIITPPEEPTITVDNLKVAQFIYLLLNNAEIREVIDTVARKAVLILGRFTPERKAVLDALKDALRTYGYAPILFDFDKPSSQDLTETISTLAHLSRFIIADLTEPSSIPYELREIVPNRMVPVQPLFKPTETAKQEFALFHDLRKRFHWVLPTHEYHELADLLTSLQAKVIEPAEQKVRELADSEKRIVSSDSHTMFI